MAAYTIAEMADILHQAALLYMSGNIPIDYGTGEKYTSVEVHMLKYIADHPEKTVTELSQDFDKTKAAISQMMKKIEEKGLVGRYNTPDNRKRQLYFATEKGLELNEKHEQYDTKVFGRTLEMMEEHTSEQDIETCFRVLEDYIAARRRKHYRSADTERKKKHGKKA